MSPRERLDKLALARYGLSRLRAAYRRNGKARHELAIVRITSAIHSISRGAYWT